MLLLAFLALAQLAIVAALTATAVTARQMPVAITIIKVLHFPDLSRP